MSENCELQTETSQLEGTLRMEEVRFRVATSSPHKLQPDELPSSSSIWGQFSRTLVWPQLVLIDPCPRAFAAMQESLGELLLPMFSVT
jgi:hypothetical protein